MTDILLATEDITVLGGPTSISVDLDFGPQGERGSLIFVGMGDPNLNDIGQIPNIFDLYINIDPNHEDYLYQYQYQNIASVNTWTKILKLIPNTYSSNLLRTFTDGSTNTINIPLINIIPADQVGLISSSNFNIQHSIVGSNPIASSILVGDVLSVNEILSLPITINAAEYVSSSWIPLSGPKTIHLFVNVVV